MTSFYRLNNFNSNSSVESKFTYNYYEKNEGIDADGLIRSSTDYSNREISIAIKYKTGYEKSNDFIKEYIGELNSEFLSSIDKKRVDNKTLEYFNNIDQKNEFIEKNFSFEQENVDSFNESLNVNAQNYFESFEKISLSSKKVSIKRKKQNTIFYLNKSNVFFDEDQILNKDFYLNSVEEKRQSILEKANFLDYLRSYNEKNIYDCNTVYFYHVGILAVKYVKNTDGSYKKIANKFYKNPAIDLKREQELRSQCKYSIYDEAIKYGKTYRYITYPVFNITFPKFKDFHVLQDFLYCDTPIDSGDIVCKEKDRPFPPSYMRFSIIKNKVNIEWKPDNDGTGDLKGYQIFKRYSLDQPFKLVKQIEYHLETDVYDKNLLVSNNNIEKRSENQPLEYYDKLEKEKIVIYSICSIDAHGQVSNYSTQIAIKYNFFTKKLETDLVSTTGAPLFYPNVFVKRKTKFFDNDDKFVTITPKVDNISKITLYATPDFAIINDDNVSLNNIYTYKEKYKFNIFKVENSKNFIDDIEIENFKN